MKSKNSSRRPFLRLILVFAFVAGAFSVPAYADAVTHWNQVAVQTIVAAGAARPGPSSSLDMAMVHGAIYDAVQSIEGDFHPYFTEVPGATGSSAAAAAAAAHGVLVGRFPTQSATLDAALQNFLITNGVPLDDPGLAVGQTVAARMLAARACDGSFPSPAPPPYIGSTEIGQWRPTGPAFSAMNPGPWLGQVTPFLLTRSFQFRSVPPPALTSNQYARDYREVQAYGSLNSTARTPDQTDMARFWASNYLVTMNATLRQLSEANVDNVSDSSRLFALATMATADTVIGTWNDKAYYNLWRPDTAIHNGDIDGNSRTVGDPTWTPLIPNPPYPDYGSGANGYTASTMHALEYFFGTDKMSFDITTTNTGPTNQDTRSYTSFSQVMDEVVDARVFLGIHFRFADVASRKQGRAIAKFGYKNYFRPVKNGGGDDDDDLTK